MCLNSIFGDFLRVLQSSMKTNQVKYMLYKIRGDQATTHFPSSFSCFFIISIISVLSGRERGSEQPDLYKFSTDAVVRNVFVLQGPAQKVSINKF